MLRKTNSIVLRTSLLFALLTAAVVFLMGIVVRISVDKHFAEMDRVQIEGKMELIQHILSENNGKQEIESIRQKLAEALVGHHDLLVSVTTSTGKSIFSSENSTLVDNTAVVISNTLQTWSVMGSDHRGMKVTTPEGYQILVAIDVSHHKQFLHQFEWQLLGIGCCGSLAMAILGWFAARRGLKPVQDMALVTAAVSVQQLHKRLPLEKLPVELQTLAHSFNAMLDRLEDSLKRLSEFSSDIAHELRTPISNLMAQTQVSLSKPRDNDTYREVLYANLEEYERLARMISDMLFLAKADNGLITPSKERVDLAKEIHSLCEFYSLLAEEKSVRLITTGDGYCQGDTLMLRRAIGNVLTNAIRHANAGTTIYIAINSTQDHTEISITNKGDLIEKENLSRIFDRFYRSDSSRKQSDEGAGLGLSITRSIMKSHGGEIYAEAHQDKTTILLKFPT